MAYNSIGTPPHVPDFWISDFLNHHQNPRKSHDTKLMQTSLDNSKKFFLVQFGGHPQNLIHAVLTENEVSRPIGNDISSSSILINDGHQITAGTLLFTNENEDFINAEFQKLKIWSFQKGFDENDNSTTIGPNTWILVLYTCHTANIVYTIINNRDTFQGIRNPYADVICYLNFGDRVYQAIIVRKSESYEDILEALTAIKNGCLELVFPLKHDPFYDKANSIPPAGFQSLCGTVEEFLKRSDCSSYAKLDANLMRLEKSMQGDALVLLEWINALEHMKQQAEEHKNYLDQLKQLSEPRESANSMNVLQSYNSPKGSN